MLTPFTSDFCFSPHPYDVVFQFPRIWSFTNCHKILQFSLCVTNSYCTTFGLWTQISDQRGVQQGLEVKTENGLHCTPMWFKGNKVSGLHFTSLYPGPSPTLIVHVCSHWIHFQQRQNVLRLNHTQVISRNFFPPSNRLRSSFHTQQVVRSFHLGPNFLLDLFLRIRKSEWKAKWRKTEERRESHSQISNHFYHSGKNSKKQQPHFLSCHRIHSNLVSSFRADNCHFFHVPLFFSKPMSFSTKQTLNAYKTFVVQLLVFAWFPRGG